MGSRKSVNQIIRVMAVVLILGLMMAPAAVGAENGEEAAAGGATGIGEGLAIAGAAIGAGLAVLGGALGTGRAQAAIGAGGTGAMAEKPELFGRIFILVALPETVIVLGFVLGFLILGLVG